MEIGHMVRIWFGLAVEVQRGRKGEAGGRAKVAGVTRTQAKLGGKL